MSDSAHPEMAAVSELGRLVRHLGDELAGYRKRALAAEARLKTFDERASTQGMTPERSFELEEENAALRVRLETARTRTQAMLDRVRFLRQQHDAP